MKRIAFAVAATLAAATAAAQTPAAGSCAGSRDLRLVNGKIATMDAKNSIVSEVTIQDGVFTAVGKGSGRLSPCTQVIDLRGRTAVPGLVDNHNHIVLLGLRPGHDTRLETAASIADVQAAIKARAEDRAGRRVHHRHGRVEFRRSLPRSGCRRSRNWMPPIPSHPVIVYQSFTGPAAVNTPGKAFFAGKGIAVSDAGAIAINAPSVAALDALRAAQTPADRKRGTLDAMAYSASVGITTNVDMGAFVIPGLPDIQDSFASDNLASADPFHMYDAVAAIHRERKMPVRVRLFFLSMDTRPDIPMLKQRLLNSFPGFGDDMLRLSGVGEFATSWPLFGQPAPTNYDTALQFVAETGLAVSAAQPVAGRRQADHRHVRSRQQDDADCAAALVDRACAAHRCTDHQPLQGARRRHRRASLCVSCRRPGAGPPLRTIVDSGIHVGAGSDSAQSPRSIRGRSSTTWSRARIPPGADQPGQQ